MLGGKGGPFVLSEHGAKARNPLKDCVTAVFAPQRLTPVERSIITVRRMTRIGRQCFLYPVTGLLQWLDIRAGFPPYRSPRFRGILMRMAEEILDQAADHEGTVEYQKGCPICEHSDPELERELIAWAQLLWDHFSSKRKKAGSANIDIAAQSHTLKERSNQQPTQQA
jgi:hypothetical protein